MASLEAAVYGFTEKENETSSATYTVYNIVVFDRLSNSVTRFVKRYSEFSSLHEKLKGSYHEVAMFPFPPKGSGFGKKTKIAAERKAAFNDYLQLLLTLEPLPNEVKEFLNLLDNFGSSSVMKAFGRFFGGGKKVVDNSPQPTPPPPKVSKPKATSSASNGDSSSKKSPSPSIEETTEADDDAAAALAAIAAASSSSAAPAYQYSSSKYASYHGGRKKKGSSTLFNFIIALTMSFLIVMGSLVVYLDKDPVSVCEYLISEDFLGGLIFSEPKPKRPVDHLLEMDFTSGIKDPDLRIETDLEAVLNETSVEAILKAAGVDESTAAVGQDGSVAGEGEGEGASGATDGQGQGQGEGQGKKKKRRRRKMTAEGEQGTAEGSASASASGSEVAVDAEGNPTSREAGGSGGGGESDGSGVVTDTTATVTDDDASSRAPGSTNEDGTAVPEKKKRRRRRKVPTGSDASSAATASATATATGAEDGRTESPAEGTSSTSESSGVEDKSSGESAPVSVSSTDSAESASATDGADGAASSQTGKKKRRRKKKGGVDGEGEGTTGNAEGQTPEDSQKKAEGDKSVKPETAPAAVDPATTTSKTSIEKESGSWSERNNEKTNEEETPARTQQQQQQQNKSKQNNFATEEAIRELLWKLVSDIRGSSTNKLIAAVLVCLLTFMAISNKLMAVWFGMYLRSQLGAGKKKGSFQLVFGSVSLRLGFDRSELLIENFKWKNPPEFKETPYFIKIGHFTIRFSLFSAIGAFLSTANAITLHSLELDEVEIYIEKARVKGRKYDALNMWTAMGAQSEAEEKAVQSTVQMLIDTAVGITQSVAKTASAAATTIIEHISEKASTATSVKADSSVSGSAEMMGGAPRLSSKAKTAESGKSKTVTIAGDLDTKVKSNHFGIPFKFEVARFLLQDFRLHATDYFNATHSEATESKAIKLSVISMDRTQLMKDTKTAFADEVLWRVVGRLSNEVLAKNKVSIATNVISAAANQTVSAVREVAASAARGVTDTIIAHNPKELIYMANRAIHRRSITPSRNTIGGLLSPENDPAKVGKSGVSKLRVRVLEGRGLRQADVPLESPLVCSVRLVYPQNAMTASESIKSHPKRPNEEFIVSWDETITVGPIVSMEAQLHVRVFEFHLLKDSLVCEAFLPLMTPPDPGSVTAAASPNGQTATQTANAPAAPSTSDTAEGDTASATTPSGKSKLAEFMANTSPAGASSKPKAAGSNGDATSKDDGTGAAGEDASGKQSENGTTDTKEAGLGGLSLGGSSSDHSVRKQAVERKLLVGVDGEEVEGWYKCYGRQTGIDRHREKGEIHLGLLLE